MVKLLRLTTENNCEFAADLDAGIEVSEKSSIAVQNLTFETNYQVIDVDNSNNEVEVTWDTVAGGIGTLPVNGFIKPTNYTRQTIDTLPETVVAALNQTQEVDQSQTIDLNRNYAEFGLDVSRNDTDKLAINYKLSPLTGLFHNNDGADRRTQANGTDLFGVTKGDAASGGLVDSVTINDINTDGGIVLGNCFQTLAINAATSELKHFVFPSHSCGEFSRGAGVFFCSIANLVDNAGASATNGFGIGLSFTDLQQNIFADGQDRMDNLDRDFEIRCKKVLDPFTFHTPEFPGVEQTSVQQPFQVDIVVTPNQAQHDLMMIERRGGTIIGSICNLSGGNQGQKIPLFEYDMSPAEMEKPLFPYIYFCGIGTQAICGHPVFTPHVIDEDNLAYERTGQRQDLIIPGSGAPTRNAFQLYVETNTVYTSVLANILNDEQFVNNVYSTAQRMEIKIDSEIAKVLGYDVTPGDQFKIFNNNGANNTRIRTTNKNVCGYDLIANNLVQATNSDNYSVIIDSNPVMSYDASKFDYVVSGVVLPKDTHKRGRQLNILATLPVNDTSGIVEFSANELVYIDLDNRFPQVLKNIRVRVLNKDFKPIETLGQSVLTLLIKDE